MDQKELDNRFTFHPANTPDRQVNHQSVRDECRDFSRYLNGLLPEGREKALALTHLEEVMMWSNAALARQE